jgi:hypothetical protein
VSAAEAILWAMSLLQAGREIEAAMPRPVVVQAAPLFYSPPVYRIQSQYVPMRMSSANC